MDRGYLDSTGHSKGMEQSLLNAETIQQRFGVPELMSREQVAQILGMSPNTLRNRNSAGLGPFPLKGIRSVRYHPADVNAWLEAQRIPQQI